MLVVLLLAVAKSPVVRVPVLRAAWTSLRQEARTAWRETAVSVNYCRDKTLRYVASLREKPNETHKV